MTSQAARARRSKAIGERASQPPPPKVDRCTVWGCFRPTQRSSGKGLSERYCRSHQEHYRRHGSYSRRSYTVQEIMPFRDAARRWLRQHEADAQVLAAIQQLDSLLATAGRPVSAFKLRGRPPKERARLQLARLHSAGKTGRQLLEIVLTIKAAIVAIGPRGNPEFQHVQIGKMAHRLSSGTILRNHEGTPYRDIYAGKPSLFERYPRAEGIFMRILGKQIQERADTVVDGAVVSEILAMIATTRGKT